MRSPEAEGSTRGRAPNPVPHHEVFPAYENLRDLRCQQLRRRYRLDGVVRGETDDFRRILVAAPLTSGTFASTTPTPRRPAMTPSAFWTRRARRRFHCAHFS
jgi:hypothetical protein